MANPQHEPTMEEILASIRKIISDDSPAAPLESQQNGEAGVLDLTQEVHDTAPYGEAEPPGNAERHEPCHAPAHAATAAIQSGDGLFSEKTRAATDETLTGLEPPGAESSGESAPGGESVEAAFERAVKEAFEPVLEKWLAENTEAMLGHMKPVIREWLDEHFPAMLENAVKSELARAARTRSR